MMTRQHFKMIAEAIRTFEPTQFILSRRSESEDQEQTELLRKALASHFARELRYTNGNFDRDHFIKAATEND